MTLRGARQADFAYQAVYRYMISLINEVSTDTRVKLAARRWTRGVSQRGSARASLCGVPAPGHDSAQRR
jgi:hypothetical protein